jgi:ABC-2 type transport system ATP-binding protein
MRGKGPAASPILECPVASEHGPVLEVRGATRRFGHHRALCDVGLTIAGGEIFALIGPNGAGKTTLVRAITGRLPLDGGSVLICGRPVRRNPETRRLLGLVPQSVALYPHLTARENLEVLGRLSGVPARDLGPVVDAALSQVGLAGRAADRTARLSGGMQRRLNIVAGTLHRPRLLVLDEPTVGVDLRAREAIHALLRDLRGRGLAVLLTTHDLDQAADLADRIGILAHGRLVAVDTPAALVNEVCGEERELRVALSQAPDRAARAFLQAAGLTPAEGDRTWTGPLRGGLDRLAHVSARLAELNLAVDEVRVREPGLRGVFFRLTGEEFAP